MRSNRIPRIFLRLIRAERGEERISVLRLPESHQSRKRRRTHQRSSTSRISSEPKEEKKSNFGFASLRISAFSLTSLRQGFRTLSVSPRRVFDKTPPTQQRSQTRRTSSEMRREKNPKDSPTRRTSAEASTSILRFFIVNARNYPYIFPGTQTDLYYAG